MVPLTAIWLPRFILFKEAGLINGRLALAVPALMGTSPFNAMLFCGRTYACRASFRGGAIEARVPFVSGRRSPYPWRARWSSPSRCSLLSTIGTASWNPCS